MQYDLFSATGCMRCKIVKSYMADNSIAYKEFDFKLEGKDKFNAFYRKNRSNIYRGEEGIEFPIIYNGKNIIQGVGVIIAFLKKEDLLEQFVTRSILSHGWVSGLNASAVDISSGDDFILVVKYLKTHGLKIQIETDGRNAEILSSLIEQSLVDRVIFNLKGPAELYEILTGIALNKDELKLSLYLLEKCLEYQIILSLHPFLRAEDQKDFITVEEAVKAAAFVEQATNRKTHPFFIKEYISSSKTDKLPVPNLFKYRTACRRYMVKTEILKD
jgi:glutaredoxin